jgi:hypothetical protein
MILPSAPDQFVGCLRVVLKHLSEDPDGRDCRTERVAQRCIAATRIPPVKAFRNKAQADDALVAAGDRQAAGAIWTMSVPPWASSRSARPR